MRHGYDVGPSQSNSGVQYPYENYHVSGPNPAPGLQSEFAPSEFRLHAPIAAPIPEYVIVDATTYIRVAGVQYPVSEIPAIPQYHFTPGSVAPRAYMQRGWAQQYVPELVPGPQLHAQAPALVLSQPIRWDLSASLSQQVHAPSKGKAPKAH